ncbi:sensor histidine kinase [Kribbella sp. NPDC048915]|uniref:sensor histidine kinase n=1 Tax=Kribbella sp. NPDC048915 TaxID=3155148 RepID=UPI0033F05929
MRGRVWGVRGSVALGLLVLVAAASVGVGRWEREFGGRSAEIHLALETVNACIALLLAFLVYGRFRRTYKRQDLLLLQGLVVLGTANALLTVTLVASETGAFGNWLPPALRIVGTVLIAASALSPDRLARRRGWRHWALAPAVVAMLVVAAIVYWRRDSLPPDPDTETRLVPQLLTLTCFAVAAVAFTLQARSRDDELLRWLGPACAVGALARLSYLVFPPERADSLYSGSLLRTASYLLLLVAAGREISRHWALQAQAAVAEDRRRLAREMHDGVLQELGYIRSEVTGFREADPPRVERILAAGDRALDETRQMVEALGRPDDEPLGLVLHRAVEQLSQRYGVVLDLQLDEAIVVDRAQRHALVRIAREAVLNAVRHGKVDRVRVELGRDADGSRLVVQDGGPGFDPATRYAGFGLVSMRERAEALPGTFAIESRPGWGTRVTITW